MSDVIRVVVCDDHPMVREGLRAVINDAPGFEMVAEAATGEEAVELALEVLPDVLVMDLHLPGINGIEAIRRITAAAPSVAVLVLTMFEDDDSVFSALRAGARGYLLKGAGQADILRSLEAVNTGQAIFGPSIASRVLAVSAARPEVEPLFPELTDREREVLSLVAMGLDNAGIARKLVVSHKTVANHVSNIFSKLHFESRAQAIVTAREAGLAGGDT